MMIPRPSRKRRGQVMAEINIVPFTDVVLVLMIILMVSASFVGASNAIDVRLPAAKAAEALEQNPRRVDVAVQTDGDIYVNANRIALKDLAGTLKAMHQQSPIHEVIVRGDRHVRWERAVEVMDAAKQAGVLNVSLATRPAD